MEKPYRAENSKQAMNNILQHANLTLVEGKFYPLYLSTNSEVTVEIVQWHVRRKYMPMLVLK